MILVVLPHHIGRLKITLIEVVKDDILIKDVIWITISYRIE